MKHLLTLWFIFGMLLCSLWVFTLYANAAELCSAGFKTQDAVDFSTPNPRFTILIPDPLTTPSCDGKTGITYLTSGLYISLRVDNEPTATIYTGAALQDIVILGKYQLPTSGKIRVKAVSDLSQPGVLEIQPNTSFFKVPGSRRVDLCVGGIADVPDPICEKIYIIQPKGSCGGCSS